MKPSNVEQSAGEYGKGFGVFDASKKTYIGQVGSRGGGYGFIKCDETFAIYDRDVYMYRTYFSQCQIGDWVKFNIHISEKGLPQVCWLEVQPWQDVHIIPVEAQGGAVGQKRPMDAAFAGAKRPAWGQAEYRL